MTSCKSYERECYNYLKSLFEKVIWNKGTAHHDFSCYNNNLFFDVDAKQVNQNTIMIQRSQLNCPLFIIKNNKKFILCSLKTLIERTNAQIIIDEDKKLSSSFKILRKSYRNKIWDGAIVRMYKNKLSIEQFIDSYPKCNILPASELKSYQQK